MVLLYEADIIKKWLVKLASDVYCNKLASMIEEGARSKTRYSTSLPRFSSCSWSLDVAISSSHMLKLLEPSVTLSIHSDVGDNEGNRFQVRGFFTTAFMSKKKGCKES